MTWLVRNAKQHCPICNAITKQVISEEKADMNGIVMRYRTCATCNTRLHEWIAARLT
jgi:transcriptional regulator NrdR family protein